MQEVNFTETNLLLAILRDDDAEADRIMAGMLPSELTSLKAATMRMYRYLGIEIDKRLEPEDDED